ncbi:MAG: sirohydrochlorin cobaltochelatase [Oscillospiraceae bacterium]|nr:sirohydrochlorin cobaltochelatase [Oscillospiraceae bacterium]
MKVTKVLSLFLSVMLLGSLFAGCTNDGIGTSTEPSASVQPSSTAPTSSDVDAGYEEGTSSTDDIVNTTAAEKVLLVVSFGTSFNQSRHLTIGGIETALKDAYPDYQVRRAFTAQIIIDKLAEREKLNIDNIEQAMERLVLDNVKEVVVQPTTIMSGYEYDDVIAAVTPYAGKFESLKIGAPLLTSDADYDAVADIMVTELAKFETDDTTVLLMGHGTHHEANATYPRFEETLKSKGHDDILVGTVEGGVLIEDLQALLKDKGTTKVVMRPLMIVAGDHANNDMAGDEEDSWKTILTNDGYTVETVLEGLGQLQGIQDIFVRHVQDAIDSAEISVTPAAATAAAGVTADRVQNGTYSIEVDSSASMFKIIDCQLTVEDGNMSAVMTLSGQGFGKIYMGTGEQALADTENHHDFTLTGETHSFAVPVSALDIELDCAGFSIRREQWYDHTVVFKSVNIPADAFIPRQIDVVLTGGTGRAGIESPAKLRYKDGVDYAEIIWSSPNYSYMLVDGTKYLPVNTGGNSTFEIPVTLDTDMSIIACTTAMSAPQEIEYTLRFDSSSIR